MNPIIFIVDDLILYYMVNKPDLSGRVARWVLLLEDLDYTAYISKHTTSKDYVRIWPHWTLMMNYQMLIYSHYGNPIVFCPHCQVLEYLNNA